MEIINFIGFILPPVIDLINRKIANSDARFWVSIAVCVIAGAVISGVNGTITDIAGTFNIILAVIGGAQVTYKGIYEDSKVQIAIRG